MNSEVLILYTRKGCCLCQTLEKKLSNIVLEDLNPSLILSIVDIDSKKVSLDIQMKYDNEVPVMVLKSSILSNSNQFIFLFTTLTSTLSFINFIKKFVKSKFLF